MVYVKCMTSQEGGFTLISFVLNNVTGSLAGIQSFSCDWTYIGIMFNSKYM